MDAGSVGIGIAGTVVAAIILDVIRNTYKKNSKSQQPIQQSYYSGEERREGMQAINQSIESLKAQLTELRSELKREVDQVSAKVDQWANKLLEFYAKKEEVNDLAKQIKELNREIGELKSDTKAYRTQFGEINSKIDRHVEIHHTKV